MTASETIQKAIEVQHVYCQIKDKPEFAPMTGYCWKCGRNIYDPDREGHYDLNYAMTHLITGCPYCHSTYCD